MPDSLTLPAYAKVNYTLDVLSLRADGYHNMASVLQTISLADALTITRLSSNRIEIECDAPGVPSDATNLAYRAAEAAIRAAGIRAGVRIRVVKQIPAQAGLGGGSSNAAATLRGVNSLLDLDIPQARLAEMAAALGSDVPFFLTGGTAAARGRGEQVTPVPDGPPFWFVVVKPGSSVSTAWAYRALDELRDRRSARSTRDMETLLSEGDPARIAARMTNDFEPVVFAEQSAIALAHDDLLMARAHNARLCGSGAAVFGLAYNEVEAQQIARLMRLKYAEVFVCRAMTRAESLDFGRQAE